MNEANKTTLNTKKIKAILDILRFEPTTRILAYILRNGTPHLEETNA